MKCEICGDQEALSTPERDTITGVEWYMCESCRRFFEQVEKEMITINGGIDYSHDEMEEGNDY
jgi:ribosome-binding protein aMBF1 (putative translation factor)